MKIPRFRVYNPEQKKHYTITCLDFRSDNFLAKLGEDVMGGKISKCNIEMLAPMVDKRGFDVYEGDIVKQGRDRILICYDDEITGSFYGKNLTSARPIQSLNMIALNRLNNRCELLGPEVLGH